MIKPAIVAVGYNRPKSMERLLESLERAAYPDDNIELIISIDRGSSSDEVASVAEAAVWSHGTKTVVHHPDNLGLKKHILSCGDLSQKYGAVIILEDDLTVAPSFYYYVMQAADKYAENDKICGIGLYSHAWNGYGNLHFIPERNEYDVYLGQYSITWGQCWTASQWNDFKKWYVEHENGLPQENPKMPESISSWGDQSWGKYFVSYVVEKDLYYVIPYSSMSTNFSEVGQHNFRVDCSHQVPLMTGVKTGYNLPAFEDAVKYDVFFERIFPEDYKIGGIEAKNVCVNLNGIKKSPLGKEYILTEISLILPVVAEYGLRMHPIDANITHNVEGSEIKLYKCEQEIDLPVSIKSLSGTRGAYEFYGFHWRVIISEGLRRLKRAISRRL